MELPEAVRKGYFDLGKGHGGTSGMILKAVSAYVRREARTLIAAGESKREVADAFQSLAKACYETACREGWTNDYALGIEEHVRGAVMGIRVK